jgi:hypothetical protein
MVDVLRSVTYCSRMSKYESDEGLIDSKMLYKTIFKFNIFYFICLFYSFLFIN